MDTVETEPRQRLNRLNRNATSLHVLGETFLGERRRLPLAKTRLLGEIEGKLPEIQISPSEERYLAISERFCDFLPRTYASIATFCLLRGISYKDVSREALDASRLFWQIGHKQDDIIDDPNREGGGGNILRDIFSNEGIGHRKTLALLYDKIESSVELNKDDKHYLRTRIKSWFDFIGRQEDEVDSAREKGYSFEYCRGYREGQNMMAGRVICALLNWSDCRTEEAQRVEMVLPRFSYMSQIIDDIGDIPEDLAADRPSFAIGALNSVLNEMDIVKDLISRKGIKKFSYDDLRKFAPESAKLLDNTFNQYYQSALELGEGNTDLILYIAKAAYLHYAKFRDLIFRINPAWATF